jgi:hypothetical protein
MKYILIFLIAASFILTNCSNDPVSISKETSDRFTSGGIDETIPFSGTGGFGDTQPPGSTEPIDRDDPEPYKDVIISGPYFVNIPDKNQGTNNYTWTANLLHLENCTFEWQTSIDGNHFGNVGYGENYTKTYSHMGYQKHSVFYLKLIATKIENNETYTYTTIMPIEMRHDIFAGANADENLQYVNISFASLNNPGWFGIARLYDDNANYSVDVSLRWVNLPGYGRMLYAPIDDTFDRISLKIIDSNRGLLLDFIHIYSLTENTGNNFETFLYFYIMDSIDGPGGVQTIEVRKKVPGTRGGDI